MNRTEAEAINQVRELKEHIKTLEKKLAFVEAALARRHAPFQPGATIRISKRTHRKIVSPERGDYKVTSIKPVTGNNPIAPLRWEVRLSNAKISAPYYLYEYEDGWNFGPNHE